MPWVDDGAEIFQRAGIQAQFAAAAAATRAVVCDIQALQKVLGEHIVAGYIAGDGILQVLARHDLVLGEYHSKRQHRRAPLLAGCGGESAAERDLGVLQIRKVGLLAEPERDVAVLRSLLRL